MQQTLTEKIINALKLENIPPNERDAAVANASMIILQGVFARALPLLSTADGTAYDKLLKEQAGITELLTLLKEKIPDFQQILDDEISALLLYSANDGKISGNTQP